MKLHLKPLCALFVSFAQPALAQEPVDGVTSMAFPEPRLFAQTRLYRELVLPMYLTMQDPNDEEHKNGKDCRPLSCYITGGRPYVFSVIANLFCSRTGSDGAPHGYYNAGLGCPKCKGAVNYTPKYRGVGRNAVVAPPATGHASGFTDTLLINANQSR